MALALHAGRWRRRMAIILQFHRHGEPSTRGMAPDDRILGQIIIFPGVRIDRRASEPTDTAPSPRKRAQRARKKLR
jgi:hypothetical protein